jgi:hypothetical protein
MLKSMDDLEALLYVAMHTVRATIYIYTLAERKKESPEQPNFVASFPGPIVEDTANLIQRAVSLGSWVVVLAQKTYDGRMNMLRNVRITPEPQSANVCESQPTNQT